MHTELRPATPAPRFQGSNKDKVEDDTTNQYALLDYSSIPLGARQLAGTTFVIHSSVPFEGRFTLLSLLSTFLPWRVEHGCFGPARVLLYQDSLLRTNLTEWSASVMAALLGPYAKAYHPAPGKVECLENAVVARQRDTVNSDQCNVLLPAMRQTVHALCR